MRLLTLFVLFALSYTQISAQLIQDKDALDIVHQLEKKYNSFKSLEATFKLTIEIPEEESIIQSGNMIQKGNAYFLNTESQDIYSDGKSVWVHLKDDNEVQINSVEEDEASLINLSPKGIFALFDEEIYEYAIVKNEGAINQIEFKPMDQDSEFSKIRISVDTKSKSLLNTKVFYKDGMRSTLEVGQVSTDQNYDDQQFVFDVDAHPGVYVEDLRID